MEPKSKAKQVSDLLHRPQVGEYVQVNYAQGDVVVYKIVAELPTHWQVRELHFGVYPPWVGLAVYTLPKTAPVTVVDPNDYGYTEQSDAGL